MRSITTICFQHVKIFNEREVQIFRSSFNLISCRVGSMLSNDCKDWQLIEPLDLTSSRPPFFVTMVRRLQNLFRNWPSKCGSPAMSLSNLKEDFCTRSWRSLFAPRLKACVASCSWTSWEKCCMPFCVSDFYPLWPNGDIPYSLVGSHAALRCSQRITCVRSSKRQFRRAFLQQSCS